MGTEDKAAREGGLGLTAGTQGRRITSLALVGVLTLGSCSESAPAPTSSEPAGTASQAVSQDEPTFTDAQAKSFLLTRSDVPRKFRAEPPGQSAYSASFSSGKGDSAISLSSGATTFPSPRAAAKAFIWIGEDLAVIQMLDPAPALPPDAFAAIGKGGRTPVVMQSWRLGNTIFGVSEWGGTSKADLLSRGLSKEELAAAATTVFERSTARVGWPAPP